MGMLRCKGPSILQNRFSSVVVGMLVPNPVSWDTDGESPWMDGQSITVVTQRHMQFSVSNPPILRVPRLWGKRVHLDKTHGNMGQLQTFTLHYSDFLPLEKHINKCYRDCVRICLCKICLFPKSLLNDK